MWNLAAIDRPIMLENQILLRAPVRALDFAGESCLMLLGLEDSESMTGGHDAL
jgi:hypothetical protein